MKQLLCLFTLIFTLLPAAYAGGSQSDGGNGGGGFVCREENGAIKSVEILDLFEGQLPPTNLIFDSNQNLDDYLTQAQFLMESNPSFLASFQRELIRVRRNIIPMPDYVELELTNDDLRKFNQKNCKFIQIANYADHGRIYVNQEIYNYLLHYNSLNLAALYIHEAVYSLARSNVKDTDSTRSRQLTAQLLAVNSSSRIIESFMKQLSPAPAQPTLPLWVPGILNRTKSTAQFNDLNGVACPVEARLSWNADSLVISYDTSEDASPNCIPLYIELTAKKCARRRCVVYSNDYLLTENTYRLIAPDLFMITTSEYRNGKRKEQKYIFHATSKME
jgi:hypothetical protein